MSLMTKNTSTSFSANKNQNLVARGACMKDKELVNPNPPFSQLLIELVAS